MLRSSSTGAIVDSLSSPNSKWVWFHKGFVEGLKRARTSPSASDQQVERLSYDLAEAHVQNEELKTKLEDTTNTLGELQKTFQDVIYSGTTDDDALVASPRPPSPPQRRVVRTYAESLKPSNTSFSSPSSPRLSTPLPRTPSGRVRPRNFSEIARASIPGYYSRIDSETIHASVDKDLATLFREAQLGNTKSISLVKALCREAHGTPPEHKTYGQKYILARWRNPLLFQTRGGRSNPIINGNSAQLINPQYDDPPDAWVDYYTRYPKSLPKGVRVNPQTGAPLFGDIVASRLLARLRPTSSLTRAEFNVAAIGLFIRRGQFRQMIEDGHVQIPQIAETYRPFEPEWKAELEGPISILDVARHYAKCGVSVEEVEKYVEPWAKEYAKEKYEL